MNEFAKQKEETYAALPNNFTNLEKEIIALYRLRRDFVLVAKETNTSEKYVLQTLEKCKKAKIHELRDVKISDIFLKEIKAKEKNTGGEEDE